MTRARLIPILILFLALLTQVGCVGPAPTNEIAVDAADYTTAFNAAKEAVVDLRFDPDRIDARSGVISSSPKRTAGLLTPWDREQASLADEFSDTLTMARRVIRISFHEADEHRRIPATPNRQAASAPPIKDMRKADKPLVMRVRVDREVIHRAGRRISTASVRRSSYTIDPTLGARGIGGWYAVPVGRDEALEREIAGRVLHAINRHKPKS